MKKVCFYDSFMTQIIHTEYFYFMHKYYDVRAADGTFPLPQVNLLQVNPI